MPDEFAALISPDHLSYEVFFFSVLFFFLLLLMISVQRSVLSCPICVSSHVLSNQDVGRPLLGFEFIVLCLSFKRSSRVWSQIPSDSFVCMELK